MFADARRKKRRSDALIRNPTKRRRAWFTRSRPSVHSVDTTPRNLVSRVCSREGEETPESSLASDDAGNRSCSRHVVCHSFSGTSRPTVLGETRPNDAITNKNHSNLFVRPRVISFVLFFSSFSPPCLLLPCLRTERRRITRLLSSGWQSRGGAWTSPYRRISSNQSTCPLSLSFSLVLRSNIGEESNIKFQREKGESKKIKSRKRNSGEAWHRGSLITYKRV